MAALFDSLTIFDNVAFGPREHGLYDPRTLREVVLERLARGRPADRDRAEEAGRALRRPAEAGRPGAGPWRSTRRSCSTTSRRPGLDPIMSDVINELILQTQRTKHTTGVVVTHDMKTVAKVADRVVMLYPLARLEPDEPQVLYDGPPDRPGGPPRPPGPPVRPRRGRRAARRDLAAAAEDRADGSPASPRTLRAHRPGGPPMNERVMQFRIGMFVIVAGLALTMMIVWFEAPALIRERALRHRLLHRGPRDRPGHPGPQERRPGRRGLRLRLHRAGPARGRPGDPLARPDLHDPGRLDAPARPGPDRRRGDRPAPRHRQRPDDHLRRARPPRPSRTTGSRASSPPTRSSCSTTPRRSSSGPTRRSSPSRPRPTAWPPSSARPRRSTSS